MNNFERLAHAETLGYRDWDVASPTPHVPILNHSDATRGNTSKSEARVFNFLSGWGYQLNRRSVTVPDLYHKGSSWVMNPDFHVNNTNILIEVDVYNKNFTGHNKGFPATDLFRTDSLKKVGYRVLRYRVGGLSPVEGATNVINESTYITTDSLTNLAERLNTLITTPYECVDDITIPEGTGKVLDNSNPANLFLDTHDSPSTGFSYRGYRFNCNQEGCVTYNNMFVMQLPGKLKSFDLMRSLIKLRTELDKAINITPPR